MARQIHQETIIDNDYFDDDEVDDTIMDEEFNPAFTINQSLLNERVYPVIIIDVCHHRLFVLISIMLLRLFVINLNKTKECPKWIPVWLYLLLKQKWAQ